MCVASLNELEIKAELKKRKILKLSDGIPFICGQYSQKSQKKKEYQQRKQLKFIPIYSNLNACTHSIVSTCTFIKAFNQSLSYLFDLSVSP